MKLSLFTAAILFSTGAYAAGVPAPVQLPKALTTPTATISPQVTTVFQPANSPIIPPASDSTIPTYSARTLDGAATASMPLSTAPTDSPLPEIAPAPQSRPDSLVATPDASGTTCTETDGTLVCGK